MVHDPSACDWGVTHTVQSHEALLEGVFGRIRDVVAGPDGALYFTTSNRDGRAQAGPNDDQVLRVVPAGG